MNVSRLCTFPVSWLTPVQVGHDETDTKQMPLVFKTAAEAGDFVLFFSFDCSKLFPAYQYHYTGLTLTPADHFNTEGSSDIILSEYLVPYALDDIYYKVDGSSFVSTFAGDNAATYLDVDSDISASEYGPGGQKVADELPTSAWSALISSTKSQSPSIPIYFVPRPLGDSVGSSFRRELGDDG